METETQTIADFLLARIAEDEAYVAESDYEETDACRCGDPDCPARVLADIKWKRRIVGLHRIDDPNGAAPICNVCLYEPPCDTLLSLAQPYAYHPGFREEWRV